MIGYNSKSLCFDYSGQQTKDNKNINDFSVRYTSNNALRIDTICSLTDSQDVPLRSPAHPRKHSESSSSDSDADRSGTPENESYSESDGDERDKSVSPARSSVSSQSVKNFSIQIKNLSTRTSGNYDSV